MELWTSFYEAYRSLDPGVCGVIYTELLPSSNTSVHASVFFAYNFNLAGFIGPSSFKNAFVSPAWFRNIQDTCSKGWTTKPNRPNRTQTYPNQSIRLNHLVQNFINPNGSVWFGFKPNQIKKPKYFLIRLNILIILKFNIFNH